MNNGSTVHCTFLDASKAFDKVLLNGLYLKLTERGAPFSFIRILMALYSGLQCAVVWNGIVGYRSDVKCGVRQGGVLSPVLTSFQSTLMISLKNFDSLVTVYMLVRCLWAASSMPMILCCFLVTVMVHKKW